MTGFGSAEYAALGWHFAIDIRSVNGRFLDFSLRCPDEIRQLEPWLREQIASLMQRGKVEMRINLRRQAAASDIIQLNESVLAQVLALVSDIRTKTTELTAFSPLELLRFPGITVDANQVEQAMLQESIKKLAAEAIENLDSAREAEGARLASFLKERVAAIRKLCRELEQQLPNWSTALEMRLKERLSSIGFGNEQRTGPQAIEPASEPAGPLGRATNKTSTSDDGGPGLPHQSLELQQRIAQELGLFAMKSDVAEELSRLRAHTEAVDQIIDKGGPCGKRLDFMMQELQREANTLGAKSQMLEQSMVSVELKVLIEQMREQIQNLE